VTTKSCLWSAVSWNVVASFLHINNTTNVICQ